jgi:YVTN family beta-propeller protein
MTPAKGQGLSLRGLKDMNNLLWRILLLLVAFAALAAGILTPMSSRSTRATWVLLVVNKAGQTLSIVDPEAGRELAAVPVGGKTGHEVAVSPDGRTAWVPVYGDSGVGQPGTDGKSVSVIDLKSRARIADVDLHVPSRPHAALFGPRDGRLYVTAELTRSIVVIDPATRRVVDSIPTGAAESHMLALSDDGKRAYTSNVGEGTVSAIDLATKKVLAVIPVAKTVQRIAISSDGRWVFTADQTKPQLAVIDTRTNTVASRVPLPSLGFGLTPTHDGRSLLIAHPFSGSVSILSLQSMKIAQVVRVPADPQEIVVDPYDRFAYVSCDVSKKVAVLDLSSARVEKLIEVGAGADGLALAAAAEP